MIKNKPLGFSLILLLGSMLSSCFEHSDYDVTEHTVDYRFSGGIAELFDCDLRQRYFLAKTGVHKELESRYLALKLARNDDIFLHVMGYIKKDPIMLEGVEPVDIFVVTELLSVDSSRGCQLK